jgi:pimeloyl-ACP methyl ester carboxylesterase
MPSDEFVTAAGLRTRILRAGTEGPAILLAHGLDFTPAGLCNNALAWEPVLDRLGAACRVVAFDAPGHGRTDDPTDYSLDGHLRHLRTLIQQLGLTRVHLVAHGDSAAIALALAFAESDLVASCTIAGSAAVVPAGDADINFTFNAPLRPLYSRQGQRWMLERQSYSPSHIDEGGFLNEAVELAKDSTFREGVERKAKSGAAAQFRTSLARTRTALFVGFRESGLPVPALLAWGLQDPVAPFPFARSLFALVAERQSSTQLRVFNRAGHMAFREQPEMFSAALAHFVQAVEGGDRADVARC